MVNNAAKVGWALLSEHDVSGAHAGNVLVEVLGRFGSRPSQTTPDK